MKCLINTVVVIALVVKLGAFGADVLPKNCVEDQVLNLLAKWRNGSISSMLPSLETINIPSVEGAYEGFGIKISYTTGDMQLSGVNKFIIEEMSISAQNLEASTFVHFPLLMLTADNYRLKGRAYALYSLTGAGIMKATFQNVKVRIGTKLITKETFIQVDEVNLNFSVGGIQVDLQNSSWPINKVLNSSAMKIVENYRSTLITAAKDMLKQIINEYLATTTSAQLLDIAGKDYCNYSLTSLVAIS